MKKIIAVIQAAALFVLTTAFAEQVSLYKPTINEGKVTVTGSIPEEYAGQNVSVQVIKPNGTFGDYRDILYLSELESDEEGNFTHTFNMPQTDYNGDDTTGTYTVYAGSKGLDASQLTEEDGQYIQSFFFCTSEGVDDFIEDVQDAVDKDAVSALITSDEGRLIEEYIGVVLSEYDKLPDKTNVLTKLESGTFANKEAFAKTFNDAILIEILNANLSDNTLAMDKVRPFEGYLGIDYTIYDAMDADDTVFFNERFNAAKGSIWNSADTFKTAVKDAMVLININSVTLYKDIWATVEKYLDVLSFAQTDMDYYKALTAEADIYTINKALTNQNFTTLGAVNSAFSQAIATLKNSKLQNNTGGSPSGGGGGGSSGGGGGVSMVPVPNTSTDVQASADTFFNDVAETYWAYEFIKSLKAKGVLNGDENGNFNPEQTLTREIFVTMLVRGLSLPVSNQEISFTDVSADDWYADYVLRAAGVNIVRGMEDGSFGIGAEISRQDMAVMIYRAAKYKGIELMPEDVGELFGDDANISLYAREAVYSLKNSKIISGISETEFAPNEKSTKAQAAKLICSLTDAM